jgi:hypothetical protein
LNGGEREREIRNRREIFNITHTLLFFFFFFFFLPGRCDAALLLVDTTPQLVAIYIDVHAHKRRHTPHGLFDSHSISLSPIRSSGGRIKGGSLFFFAYIRFVVSSGWNLSPVLLLCVEGDQEKHQNKKIRGGENYISMNK